MKKFGAILLVCALSTAWVAAEGTDSAAGTGDSGSGASAEAKAPVGHGPGGSGKSPHSGPGGWGGGMFMSPVEGEGLRAGMMIERIVNNPELAEKVGLTEEQVKTLSASLSETKKEQIKLKADLEVASLEQADKIGQETIDEKALLAAVEKTGELRTKMAKLAVQQLVLMKKTLTAEQIKKMKQLAKGMHRERMNEWRERKNITGKKEEVKESRKADGAETKQSAGESADKNVVTNQ